MKKMTSRILSLLCVTILLLTCVMALTGCGGRSVEEYEEAFFKVYEKENAVSIKDEFALTDVRLDFGSGANYYCTGYIFFTNTAGNIKVLALENIPIGEDEILKFVNSFSREALYLDAYEKDQAMHRKATITVEKLSDKEKVKLYEVFLERCLQDYPDLLEN